MEGSLSNRQLSVAIHSQVRQLCLNSVVGYAELNSASPTLKMYLNGMGLRGIERVTKIHHTTVMNWIKEAGLNLPDTPEESEIPETTEIDELFAKLIL